MFSVLFTVWSGSTLPVRAQDDGNLPLRGLSNSTSDQLYYSQPEKIAAPEELNIGKPALSALIEIDRRLNPLQLDASSTKPISLSNVIDQVLLHNLDIRISTADVNVDKFNLLSSYGAFLPSVNTGYLYTYLKGNARLPANTPIGKNGAIHFDNPFTILQAGVNYYAFQGGRILFTAQQNLHTLRATKHKSNATLKDALLEASRRYYSLVLNQALLQIRIRAVDTSKEQLAQNKALEANGFGTHLDVLQAQTQLSQDTQSLIEQQIARRKAAVFLADYLDADQSIDFEPVESKIRPLRLVSEEVTPTRLVATAVENRPELKQYEELRLAARKAIGIATASLFPKVKLSATEYGVGETLGNSYKTVVASAATTGLLSPVTLGTTAGATGTTSLVTRQNEQVLGFGAIGFQINWDLEGFGTVAMANRQAARWQAREAMLQSHKELNTVVDQIRQSFLDGLSAFRKMDETKARIVSSAEELRLAQLRLENGLGQNINVLRAQQDYTNALIEHARSTIEFNIAQVQLLHDLGIISRTNLLADKPMTFQ